MRVQQGYTQVSLAKKLSVSKQAVSNWENGNIQPSIDMLLRIADLFSVTTDYLLGREYSLQRLALEPAAAGGGRTHSAADKRSGGKRKGDAE